MWARLAIAATAVTTLIGCSGGGTGTAARPSATVPAPMTATQTGLSNGLAAVASVYSLFAVDGHALPYAPSAESGTVPTQVVSGALNLQADGTFSLSTKYRAIEPQGERTFDGRFSGACARTDDGYRLFWDGGGETALTVSGDTVIVNNGGVRFSYVKGR
jgi:hypothetical protein